MQVSLFLVLISFSTFIDCISATCTVSSEDGVKSLKCQHTSLEEIAEKKHETFSSIFITLSKLPSIPANTFASFGSMVQSLTLQNCQISTLDYDAFNGLTNLKKLSLANNNISNVPSEWFNDMRSLEELNLSFNQIKLIEASVFRKLLNLRNLILNNNQINCLIPGDIEPMRSLNNIRIEGNPYNFICRGKLTRWLKDKGVIYASEEGGFKYREDFLDSLIWRCAIDPEIGSSETKMKECVLLNLYNQLQTALVTSCSFPSVAAECINERSALLNCIQQSGNGNINNGEAVRKLLLALRSGYKR
ncbi:peroxidasin-like [Belonocnema kinseyi]|uniref:peroxidasin-like n=1 Tax=Belonocnema kinseyi TaxID=2817044 RepID=UPI00143D8443|nr:peroxidasin-like [Belonocnema kinseyi]